MKLGLDIGYKTISMAVVKNDGILDFLDKPIAAIKRDCDRIIMDKILTSIHSVVESGVGGIGLSLPSIIDKKRGVTYDINSIPYWKGMGIKKILEGEFNTKVWINNDINCFILGEKYYGMCKDFNDIICVSLGPHVGVGAIVNNKFLFENNYKFYNSKHLPVLCYDCVRKYKSNFIRTTEELSFLLKDYKDQMADIPDHRIWNDLGVLAGKLITILLCNYSPQVIVLGGHLARYYAHFSESMDKYMERFIHPQILLNMIVFTPIADHQQALGATSMVRQSVLIK